MKADPAPNSIEGERSQFDLTAEGRLQQFVKLQRLQKRHFHLVSLHFMEKELQAAKRSTRPSINRLARGGCTVALSSEFGWNLVHKVQLFHISPLRLFFFS